MQGPGFVTHRIGTAVLDEVASERISVVGIGLGLVP